LGHHTFSFNNAILHLLATSIHTLDGRITPVFEDFILGRVTSPLIILITPDFFTINSPSFLSYIVLEFSPFTLNFTII
jgi:hypothetical protein